MDKRIALQLFGQLRFWPEQKTIIPFVDKLRDAGYLVDIYGTFWNDEYTMNLNTHGKLDIFSKLQLDNYSFVCQPHIHFFTLTRKNTCHFNSALCKLEIGYSKVIVICEQSGVH